LGFHGDARDNGPGAAALGAHLIEVEAVSFRRPTLERPVLQDVSLRLLPGERVALLGGNGSGKSTLVRLLNGSLQPETGQVVVEGMSTADSATLHEVRQRVGLLFQDPDNQFVTTTAQREIAFGLENLQVPAEEMRQQVQQALEDYDLLRYQHTPPHEMSGGEKARLALACVWVMGATALLLDETDSLLDRHSRERLVARIAALPPETTVLMVTTEPDVASEADRVLVLHEGRLVADGPPDSVWRDLSEPVAASVGLPLVWRLSVQLQQAGRIANPTSSWDRLVAQLEGSTDAPGSSS